MVLFFYVFVFTHILFLFSLIGVVTVLESKVLSFVKNSSSVISFNLFGLYQFVLDFLKMLFKGMFCSVVFKLYCFLLLCFLSFILLVVIFYLPMNCLSMNFYYGFLIFIIVDGCFILLKILMFNYFSCKYVVLTLYSIKKLYFFIESLFFIILFILFILFSFFNIYCCVNLISMFYFNVLDFLFVFIFVMFSFVFMLLKFFKVPFDYIELESEMVGGLMLEFYGLMFLMWSLFEYGIILIYILFLFGLIGWFIFYYCFYFYIILMLFLLLFLMFIFSGVLMSFSYFSIYLFFMSLCFFIILFYVLLFLCLYVIFYI